MSQSNNSRDDFLAAMEERRTNPSKRGIPLPEDFASRPFGLLLLAMCRFFFWDSTWAPLQAAQRHKDLYFFSARYVWSQPALFALGLIYTVFGQSASRVLGPSTKPSRYGFALMVLLVPAGMYYTNYVTGLLHQLGYNV